MKFLTFRSDGFEMLGLVSEDGRTVYPLNEIGLSYFNMTDLVTRLTEEDRQKALDFLRAPEGGILYEETEKCAPIPRPAQDVICLGINYHAHAEEAARYEKQAFGGDRPYPIYFSKRVNEAVADGGFIESHPGLVERLDYECELAVVIGREAVNVSPEEAYDYVFGYTILNDVNSEARGLLISATQDLITLAKNLKFVLEDKESTNPQTIINWKELEHFADFSIKDKGVDVYKQLHKFVLLMKGFLDNKG